MNVLVRIVGKILILVLWIVEYIAANLFPILYRKDEGENVPHRTSDDILLDSASEIVEKIPTGVVTYSSVRMKQAKKIHNLPSF